jgi:light-regulated signal transduction histidine kinase (bacteriophytochrome)
MNFSPQSEAENLSLEVNELKKKVEKLNKELNHFIYVVSHDLQEPLRMISSYVQLIRKRNEGKIDQDTDEFIGFAVDGVNRIKSQLEDLLCYSRLNTNPLNFRVLDCNLIINQVLSKVSKSYDLSKVSIEYEPLPMMKADEQQLITLFYKLIDNSLKFNHSETPYVKISSSQNKNEYEFSVEDNGIGIDPNNSQQIFEIFHKLNSNEYPGTGMGLAISKKIIENHNGNIWFTSEPGKGSIFYFTIQIVKITEN